MRLERLHGWKVSVTQAMEIQRKLAEKVSRTGGITNPHLIAGVDISVNRTREKATGAVVVLSFPELEVVETSVIVTGKLGFPYIPGLLTFREAPLILEACEKLVSKPDLILIDGQGIAHPRRMGLASHLGLFLGIPTIGCAKSRLCGKHEEPDVKPGSHAELIDGDEIIGVVLRTKAGVKPVYVSIGHKIDLQNAMYWVLECCHGYRLPEPCRLAHLAAGGKLMLKSNSRVIEPITG